MLEPTPQALPIDESRSRQRRALWIALAANGVFMVVEVVGGIVFSSLALLADAAHMFSDVVAIAIALTAQALAARPPSQRHSFGLQRAEVLGAQANAVLLLVAAAWVYFEAIRRIDAPHDVEGLGLIVVATAGLAVNLGTAWILSRVRGRSLNIRGAMLHMLSDAAGSFAAIVAGVAVVAWGAAAVDPVVSMLVGVLVVWSAWHLLSESAHVLLEGTPRGIDPADVARAIVDTDGVEGVHHLHVWNLASDVPALSAHLVIEGEVSLHEAQQRADRVKGELADRFGIGHTTLEVECHACPDPEPDPRAVPPDGPAGPAVEASESAEEPGRVT